LTTLLGVLSEGFAVAHLRRLLDTAFRETNGSGLPEFHPGLGHPNLCCQVGMAGGLRGAHSAVERQRPWEVRVPIHRFLTDEAFDQEAMTAMAAAFEDTLRELKLTDRDDPVVETVARIIIECAEGAIAIRSR
jgi:hypothetical protein